MRFFICGSALRGQPAHQNLGEATFLGEARTAPRYRVHSVRDQHPGIYEVDGGGAATSVEGGIPSGKPGISIVGELYEFSPEQHAHLMANEPPDLCEGEIVLDDGSTARAMLYPRELIEERGYEDISRYGGWAAFKAARAKP